MTADENKAIDRGKADRQAGARVCNIIHGWSCAWCADVSVSGGKEAQGQSDIPWPSRGKWVEQSAGLFKEVEIATYMEKQQPSVHEHSRSEYFEVVN